MVYKIIVKPTYNIAFLSKYLHMCHVELLIVLHAHHIELISTDLIKSNKGHFIAFEVEGPLNQTCLKAVYQLSFFFMLFRVLDGGMLETVPIDYVSDFEDDLSIRMKYNGKTNETITRMMMNLGLAMSDFVDEQHPKLLDPLCGRGTTMFEGMISGFDVYGVDRDQKSIAEMGTYITRYVKEARFKHTNKRGKVLNQGRYVGDLFELKYAKEKSDYKAGKLRELKVLRGDTTDFVGAFRQNFFHMILADFPYNVQHSSKGKPDAKGLGWLLDEGLTSWTPFLKKGGTVTISWNIYTDKREEFSEIFKKHGYVVLMQDGLDQLQHRVSQGITRDIIVAKKTS